MGVVVCHPLRRGLYHTGIILLSGLTLAALVEATNAISGDIDERRFQLCELAYEARQAHLPNWAEVMGACPKVRRSARTVREWCQVADFRHALVGDYALPFSAYAAASRYMDRVSMEVIEDIMSDAEAEGVTVEDLRVRLAAEVVPDEADPFSLADWLHEEYIRVSAVLDSARAKDDIESVRRVLDCVDVERARLK